MHSNLGVTLPEQEVKNRPTKGLAGAVLKCTVGKPEKK
jgi:hypothetical protein